MRRVERSHWRTGAVVAAVGGCGGALAHLSLRAQSEGPLSGAAGLLGAVGLTAVLWPLAARATRVLPLTLVLAAAQFGSHALAVLGTGQPRGATALVCCPSRAQTRPGPVGALTAHAGWALVAAQLLGCLVLAIGLRAARSGLDVLVRALTMVAALLGVGSRRLAAALELLATAVPPAIPVRTPRPGSTTGRVRPRPRVVTTVVRRGPPEAAQFAAAAAG